MVAVTLLISLVISVSAKASEPALSASLTRLSVEGQELSFFPEVAETLEALANGQSAEPFSAAAMTCPGHLSSARKFPEIKADSFICGTEANVLKIVYKTSTVCHEVQDPIGFFAMLPPKSVEWLKADDLVEALKTFAPVFVNMEIPGAFKTARNVELLRSILVKVRLGEIRSRIESRRSALKFVTDRLLKGNCYRGGYRGEIQRAYSEFSQAVQELDILESQLNAIEAKGLQLAQADEAKVKAQGRRRARLPYPSLTDEERRFLSFIIGGVMWRARGGGIFKSPEGTNKRRLIFNLFPMQEIARLNGGDEVARVGTDLWLGLFSPWGRFHDMGRLDGDKVTDYASMKKRGEEQVRFMIPTLELLGFDPAAVRAAGPMMGHCYWYGWERLADLKIGMNLEGQGPYSAVAGVATNWGEFCTGASISVGLSQSLLAGQKTSRR